MDDDEYNEVRRKPLKLALTKKKKKAKTKIQLNDDQISVPEGSTVIVPSATKAEQAFEVKKNSIVQARILKKASKTHKQRVEEFNKHLDSLSEHYDIPKVSWTK